MQRCKKKSKRGDEKSPLFILKMLEEKVKELLDTYFQSRSDIFLIDLSVSDTNNIKVIIDGDKGLSVNDCVEASRAIEHHLDRDEIDFSLEVTSAGATAPLVHKRQYAKHIGRTLQVKDTDGEKHEGTLSHADEEVIKLNWKTREPKPVGKGKITVQKEIELNYKQIEQAKVKLKF